MSHAQIWSAIDALAERKGMSVSALARRAGLDATAFNRSKRFSQDGRPRWPSTESVFKVLAATGESFDGFAGSVSMPMGVAPERKSQAALSSGQLKSVPLLGFAQAGDGGYFDDAGFPVGHGWDEVQLPDIRDEHAFALEVTGDSMLPLYRSGDILVVSPSAPVRRHDRVVLRTRGGEILAKVLLRQTAGYIDVHSLNPDHDDRRLPLDAIDWMARIVWASQ
ncbi:MAG: helix-turn-helix transcriptional regulator [Devosiaceae bacterium]|nr:helix-turn-helix transcriptional regulator [Devosiaceae bacterium MH13]